MSITKTREFSSLPNVHYAVFFDFVQDVLKLSTVCPIVILRKRKPFYFNTYNIQL